MKVFISKSDKDEAIYSTLCVALDSQHVERWDTETMTVGNSLSEQLLNAIKECRLCVFIATRRSIESQWCLAELGAFWGAGKTVIIFLADPDLAETVLPPQLRGNLIASNADRLITAIRDAEQRESTAPYGQNETTVCRRIRNREELYIQCLELIRSCRCIRDTTWGKRARELSPKEKKARDEYRLIIEQALDENKEYMELLTSEGRDEYLLESEKLAEKHTHYQCRVLQVDISDFAMLDMMIGDNRHMMFSHIAAEEPHDVQYLYVESEDLVSLFRQYYSDIWQHSTKLSGFLAKKEELSG